MGKKKNYSKQIIHKLKLEKILQKRICIYFLLQICYFSEFSLKRKRTGIWFTYPNIYHFFLRQSCVKTPRNSCSHFRGAETEFQICLNHLLEVPQLVSNGMSHRTLYSEFQSRALSTALLRPSVCSSSFAKVTQK